MRLRPSRCGIAGRRTAIMIVRRRITLPEPRTI
jgi:hypothetical protein